MTSLPIRRSFAWTCLLGILMPVSTVTAQEDLGPLRTYPPSLLSESYVDDATVSIKWQLKQQAAVETAYRKSRDELATKLEATEAKIEELNQSLPQAVRFLDDPGRSTMANFAMEQLLGARLELVSLESLTTQLEKNLADDQDAEHEIRKLELEMQERAALSRLELAKWEYDQSEQLHQKGVITDQTARRNRMALEAANAEYEIAAKKARMASKAVDVDMVKRLSDVRIEIQPVKAKIESLEEFLDTMQQASETFSKIKQLKRQQQLLESDLALVARALFESTRKSIELRIYQSLVENERKPSTKREDQ